MKKVLVSLIVFFVMWFFILLQINLFNVITLAGTAANIGAVFVIAMGLMCDKQVGGVIGGIYGLIIDIFSAKAIGLYMLSYFLIGYASGKIGRSFSKENKTTLVVMVGIGTILFEIFNYVLGILIYKYDISFIKLGIEIFKEAIYNMLVSIILFKSMMFLAEIINKSKNKYYLL